MEVCCRLCLSMTFDYESILQLRNGVQIREIIEKICSIKIEEDFQNVCK